MPESRGQSALAYASESVTGCGYEIVFTVHDSFVFHHLILTCQVWAMYIRSWFVFHETVEDSVCGEAEKTKA